MAKVVACGALECVQLGDETATYVSYPLNDGQFRTSQGDARAKEKPWRKNMIRNIFDRMTQRGDSSKSSSSLSSSNDSSLDLSQRISSINTYDSDYNDVQRSRKLNTRDVHEVVNESIPSEMTVKLTMEVNQQLDVGGKHVGRREYNEAKRAFVEALRIYRIQCADLTNRTTTRHDVKFRSQMEQYLEDKILQINHLLTDLQHSMDIFTIGMVRLRRKEYEKAIRSYIVALRVRQSVLGTRHPNLSTIYNYMAIAHSKLGEPAKALQFLNTAVDLLSPHIILDTSGDLEKEDYQYGIEYALTLRNFGQVHEDKNEMSTALNYYFESLNIMLCETNEIDCENEDLGRTLSKLKLISSEGGVEFLNNIEGGSLPSDPKVAIEVCLTLNKISKLYRRMNLLDSALLLSGVAVTCLRKAAGDDHPKIVSFLNDSSLLYRDAGEYDQALKMCGQVLIMNSMNKSDFKTSANETTLTLYNLGNIQKDYGDPKKAMKFFQDAIGQQLKLKFQQRDNMLVTQIMLGMASLYEDAEMYVKSEETYNNAIRTLRSHFNNTHSEVGRLHHQFGQYYQRRGLYEDAQFELTEAMNIYQANKRVGDSHPEYIMLQRDLADVKVILMMDSKSKNPPISFGLFECGGCYGLDEPRSNDSHFI